MEIIRHRMTNQESLIIQNNASCLTHVRADSLLHNNSRIKSAVISHHSYLPSEIDFWVQLNLSEQDLRSLSQLDNVLTRLRKSKTMQELVILQDVPLECDPAALLLVIGSLFGVVREFVGHGAPIVEVSDKGHMSNNRPSSDNSLEFALHTDLSFCAQTPAFVAFLMVQQGCEGGESTFCGLDRVLGRLPIGTIELLQTPFKFPPSLHRPDMGPQLFPILSHSERAGFRVRFRRDGLEALSSDQASSLNTFSNEIDDNALQLALLPGDLVIFSNQRLLHGRRQFKNQGDRKSGRLAFRAYLDVQH